MSSSASAISPHGEIDLASPTLPPPVQPSPPHAHAPGSSSNHSNHSSSQTHLPSGYHASASSLSMGFNLNVTIPLAPSQSWSRILLTSSPSPTQSPTHSPSRSMDDGYTVITIAQPVTVSSILSSSIQMQSPSSVSILGPLLHQQQQSQAHTPLTPSTPQTPYMPQTPQTPLTGSGSNNGGGLLSLSSLKSKGPKRKLVISGVAIDDTKVLEAVKSWSENFGEVSKMTRAPNRSLYVDFKKASVAETVCRLQAQVNIKGAGSVLIGWCTKKPTL